MAFEFLTIGLFFALGGAAIAAFLPGIGSAEGVGLVGRGAPGVVVDDPEKFGRLIILQAIPGTQGIYGLITCFFILNKLGFPGAFASVSLEAGVALFAASLPIAFVGWISAIHQGKVAHAGIQILVKKPDEFGKAVIFAAMVETYAVLGLLATLLMVNSIQLA